MEAVRQPRGDDEVQANRPLLCEAMEANPTLFVRENTVEAQGLAFEQVLDDSGPPHLSRRSSWGSAEADRLIPGGWHNPQPNR